VTKVARMIAFGGRNFLPPRGAHRFLSRVVYAVSPAAGNGNGSTSRGDLSEKKTWILLPHNSAANFSFLSFGENGSEITGVSPFFPRGTVLFSLKLFRQDSDRLGTNIGTFFFFLRG